MEKKTLKNILLVIMGLLILVELLIRIIVIKSFDLTGILILVSLVFTALYGFFLYKKPHGNLLKYAMLIFALANIVSHCSLLTSGVNNYDMIQVICCAAICYGAGRLSRIEQNRILFPIIDIVFLIESIMVIIKFPIPNVFITIASFSQFITFTTLIISYFVRYNEHKEAGIEDSINK